MKQDKNLLNGGIPLGLGMAFAQNTAAMKRFSEMSEAEQKTVIEKAHAVKSKEEMQAFAENLASPPEASVQ